MTLKPGHLRATYLPLPFPSLPCPSILSPPTATATPLERLKYAHQYHPCGHRSLALCKRRPSRYILHWLPSDQCRRKSPSSSYFVEYPRRCLDVTHRLVPVTAAHAVHRPPTLRTTVPKPLASASARAIAVSKSRRYWDDTALISRRDPFDRNLRSELRVMDDVFVNPAGSSSAKYMFLVVVLCERWYQGFAASSNGAGTTGNPGPWSIGQASWMTIP